MLLSNMKNKLSKVYHCPSQHNKELETSVKHMTIYHTAYEGRMTPNKLSSDS